MHSQAQLNLIMKIIIFYVNLVQEKCSLNSMNLCQLHLNERFKGFTSTGNLIEGWGKVEIL